MDLVIWQAITNQHIQYDVLALFLFPQGRYTGQKLKETIIPLVRKLLDSESKDSGFFYYIVNKNDEK